MLTFEFSWGEHIQGAVSAVGVVEDLDVVMNLIRERDPGLPFLSVQQLNLHSTPEAHLHGVVVGRANRVH